MHEPGFPFFGRSSWQGRDRSEGLWELRGDFQRALRTASGIGTANSDRKQQAKEQHKSAKERGKKWRSGC